MKKFPYFLILSSIFCFFILFLNIRGYAGNPSEAELNSVYWKENGPFELSPERGRFALAYSLAENHSAFFSLPLARFATPDVGYSRGNFVSLFAPALSFIVIPGYLIGKMLGSSQIGAFAVIALFAVLNFLLIYFISKSLGAGKIPSLLAGATFLFATPAFSYGVELYQHHVSTFFILLSIYLLTKSKRFINLLVVFSLCAASLPLDYPNLFLMLPIGIYALSGIFSLKRIYGGFSASINYLKIFTPIIMVLPIVFLLWFNALSYGSPWHFLGGSSITAVKTIDNNGIPQKTVSVASSSSKSTQAKTVTNKSELNLFQTRNLLNGFYLHFISPDRGILFFAPIMFLGAFGVFALWRKKQAALALLLGVIGADIILYSMWGDPWGGYAFGSRYLIPAYALSSILIALTLERFRKNILFVAAFIMLAFYSICISSLGALTSNANPPQVEVLALEKQTGMVQKYTYERNIDYLLNSGSKSFFYQTFAKFYVTSTQYYWLVVALITSPIFFLLILNSLKKDDQD